MNGALPWLDEVEKLKKELPLLVEKISALRDGSPIAPLSLDRAAVNDFETAKALELSLGLTLYYNAASTAAVSLNQDAPLAGEQDLLMNFVFRDEPNQPWAQWSGLSLLILDLAEDLSTSSGVRLHLKGDQPRTLRLDLESDQQTGASSGAKFGWEIQLTGDNQEVEVLFDDAELPMWATPVGDDKSQVLQSVRGLTFSPLAEGRDDAGFLGTGVEDSGFLQIDNIEFF
jgi:hypothetical protein